MPADHVERDILIEAPIEVVWEVISHPEHVARWFSDEAQLDVRPGGDGLLTWHAMPTSNHPASFPLRFEAVEPPRRLSYRWCHPGGEEPRTDNSTLVEFTLTEEGPSTRLRVVESGIQLTSWSQDEKDGFAKSHTDGWERHLEKLRLYAPTAGAIT